MDLRELLHHLTSAPPATVGSLEALVARVRELEPRVALPFDRAVLGGFDADRIGYAFGAGYQAALASLLPDAPLGRTRVFCVTEEKGGHPRAIATRIARRDDGLFLDGKKKWTTFGPLADELLVVATEGVDAAGRNALKLVTVDARRAGVTLHPMPSTPFAPELPHAELTFENVRIAESEVHEGDAYARFVKPFRTVEDVHALGAFVGHVSGLARVHGWPREVHEEALAIVVALRGLATEDPFAAETHLVLGGALRLVHALTESVDASWGAGSTEARARWTRDRSLLEFAAGARAKRLENARHVLSNVER